MSVLTLYGLRIDSFCLDDKLETQRFRNAVVDNERRNHLKNFIFIEAKCSVPKDVELFVGSCQDIDHVDVFHSDNFSVRTAI
jgi:hypothetical protein